jgi:hypothetical protein
MSDDFGTPVEEGGKRNTTLIIIVAVVVVLLLCCCGLLVAGWYLGDPIMEFLQDLAYQSLQLLI